MFALKTRGWILAAFLVVPLTARADVVEYLHTDLQGTVVAVTDETGAIIERRVHEPYGLPTAPIADGPGYTGHDMDGETGLIYMQQRYYDPEVGRFLSVDPVGVSPGGGNFNRYWYANGNPYMFVDPDGREAYLVSRPIEVGGKWFNHNFIVTNADYVGDLDSSIYSWGKNAEGNTGRVFDDTHVRDIDAWSGMTEAALEGVETRAVRLNADDLTVDQVASSVIEDTLYLPVPLTGGNTTNSNSAASAVANESEGNVVPVPNAGRSSPGADKAGRINFRDPEGQDL
jgi:RHS repeat-associated protein